MQTITVEKLRHLYRKGDRLHPALDGVSFEVNKGEIFGLLGPNGAGKTTTVRVLTTILKPTSGRATVAGHDVVQNPLAVRRSIAAVFQENAVETMLTVEDNLLLYGYMHGYSRQESLRRTTQAVELLDLGAHMRKRAQELSGGYKRRLQVAKILMVDSPVLFLDEATTGMDPIIKRDVIAAIRAQATRGRTVLLTTQLMDEAEALCDRMVLLDHGKVLASGTLAELRGEQRKMFTIDVSFANTDGEAVKALRELNPRSIEDQGDSYSLVVAGAEDEWIRKMAALSERWRLTHLEIRAASLEQIFFDLYGNGNKEGE